MIRTGKLYLDIPSQALVDELVRLLIERHQPIIQGIIVFGSVARGEARPLTDPEPSDIDILIVFDVEDRLIRPYRGELFHTIGDAHRLHMDAPREVNVMFATRTMQEWDPDFIENVARVGIILYANDPLPAALSAA
jgi:predicted nucleotidyltransferase